METDHAILSTTPLFTKVKNPNPARGEISNYTVHPAALQALLNIIKETWNPKQDLLDIKDAECERLKEEAAELERQLFNLKRSSEIGAAIAGECTCDNTRPQMLCPTCYAKSMLGAP